MLTHIIKRFQISLLLILTVIMVLMIAMPAFADDAVSTTSALDTSTYAVGGVSIIALITGLVKVARELGLPSKFAPAQP